MTTEREKALELAISQIEKRFGKGSVMKLGESPALSVEATPSGSLALDLALGIGGIPKGRITEIFGPEASGKTTEEIPQGNIYREIGFDGKASRLGWFRIPDSQEVERYLSDFLKKDVIRGKENFVFIGMGGSINTVKALKRILQKGQARYSVYALDSLDPAALKEFTDMDPAKTLVIPISKSGTTAETLNLAKILRQKFGEKWQDSFLMVTDPGNEEKIAGKGWEGIELAPIQVDRRTDIGGRFTAPHTGIFFLPVLLLLGKDTGKVKEYYEAYASMAVSYTHLTLPTN